MRTAPHPKYTADQVALYKHTHPDFRGGSLVDGTATVLRTDASGTHPTPIESIEPRVAPHIEVGRAIARSIDCDYEVTIEHGTEQVIAELRSRANVTVKEAPSLLASIFVGTDDRGTWIVRVTR